jgi:chromosomal replication initiator protein
VAYTFDSFVVGPSNRFAHAAALAVAEAPAKACNPLFVYGGPGVGKTHLLRAIAGHPVAAGQPGGVQYVPAREFAGAVPGGVLDAGVLLVDDLQLLEDDKQGQSEFFRAFTTLHGALRQVVVAADRPPRLLTSFEERVRARLEWGLLADIQPSA